MSASAPGDPSPHSNTRALHSVALIRLSGARNPLRRLVLACEGKFHQGHYRLRYIGEVISASGAICARFSCTVCDRIETWGIDSRDGKPIRLAVS